MTFYGSLYRLFRPHDVHMDVAFNAFSGMLVATMSDISIDSHMTSYDYHPVSNAWSIDGFIATKPLSCDFNITHYQTKIQMCTYTWYNKLASLITTKYKPFINQNCFLKSVSDKWVFITDISVTIVVLREYVLRAGYFYLVKHKSLKLRVIWKT